MDEHQDDWQNYNEASTDISPMHPLLTAFTCIAGFLFVCTLIPGNTFLIERTTALFAGLNYLFAFVAIFIIIMMAAARNIHLDSLFACHFNLSKTKTLVLCLIIPVLYFFTVNIIFSSLNVQNPEDSLIRDQIKYNLIGISIQAVIMAPIIEEIFYRGILFGTIERVSNKTLAIILVTLWFGLIHLTSNGGHLPTVIGITGAGFIFTYIRAKTDSIMPAIIAHFCYNAVQIIPLWFFELPPA